MLYKNDKHFDDLFIAELCFLGLNSLVIAENSIVVALQTDSWGVE